MDEKQNDAPEPAGPLSDFPSWRSHKIVKAAEICAIAQVAGKAWTVTVARPDGTQKVLLIDDPNLFARYLPNTGDFLVRYEPDGYLSASPRQTFLDGYSPV